MARLPRASDFLVAEGLVDPVDVEALAAQRAHLLAQRRNLASFEAASLKSDRPTEPADVDNSVQEAVLGLCEVSSTAARPVFARYTTAAVQELVSEWVPAQPQAPRPRGVSSAEARAAEAEAFGAKRVDDNASGAHYGARWLLDWCRRASFVGGQAESEDDAVATAAAQAVLDPGRADEALGAELFELLGPGIFESMDALLAARPRVAHNLSALLRALRREEREAAEASAAQPSSLSDTVAIFTESQRQAARRGRRGGARSRQGADSDAALLLQLGLAALAEEEDRREHADKFIRLGGVEFRLGTGVEGASGQRGLPVGTQRTVHKGYEEVTVPAARPAGAAPGEELVAIDRLPDWARTAFAGYERLNRIQSRIFPAAFETNENLLVCAPTGAGKTNIAMLAVLREVGEHVDASSSTPRLRSRDFKIVYVAPMKALAAEVTAAFAKRLAPLGLRVRELTGDMQLTRREVAETQMIVTTPEKWDVITRKGGEAAVAGAVRLLILDEVHLLNDERGPVIETLVARTQRQVESTQRMIRVVGLSATLPNYTDVAAFLGVNPRTGCFHFDASFRPVPLETRFVGVTEKNHHQRTRIMEDIAYDKAVDALRRGFQAMVFVHSRKDTGKTARALIQRAQQAGDGAAFDCTQEDGYYVVAEGIKKSRNRELAEVFESGLGIHHAGMLRGDRNVVEAAFSAGAIKVLCCTATLAWGVNLPAHTVIIKGTQLYNPAKGGFCDLGMLDVQQIFGRAGRPQFQDAGEAVIITSHDRLAHYLGMLTHQTPIESQFTEGLADHLNAEIVLGTVTSIREAVRWLAYTYLHTRMAKNPLAYGLSWEELTADPALERARRRLCEAAARQLQRCRMARYDEDGGALHVTDLGRVASHFYIAAASIEVFNERLRPHMDEADVLGTIARSKEFDNLAVREDEGPELDALARSACLFDTGGAPDSKHGKVCVLLQAHIARARVDSFSLIADLNYVAQNAGRIGRAIFEICLRRGWAPAAEVALSLCKSFDRKMWPDAHPLWQYDRVLGFEYIRAAERAALSVDDLKAMSAEEIGAQLRHPGAGKPLHEAGALFPAVHVEVLPHPVTRTVLRLEVRLLPAFQWKARLHGGAMKWHIWVEDPDNENIYFAEEWTLQQNSLEAGVQTLDFAVPIFEPLPEQYFVRVLSDEWMGAGTVVPVPLRNLVLPIINKEFTEALHLPALPTSVLGADRKLREFFPFPEFNAIQTQCFHAAFHASEDLLVAAPVGSGLPTIAELALLQAFKRRPASKVLWLVPDTASERRRRDSLGPRLRGALRRRVSTAPDLSGDVVIARPGVWLQSVPDDEASALLTRASMIVLEELEMLGDKLVGGDYEALVTRLRLHPARLGRPGVRVLGLATSLADSADLAAFLGVQAEGLHSFPPAARPLPLECHIQGFQGRFYVPRMSSMNRPIYSAIGKHAPDAPTVVYVSSRRQTKTTATDLINLAAAEGRPRAFVTPEAAAEVEDALVSVQDPALADSLQFGIALYHEALSAGDSEIVERLFASGAARVMIATSSTVARFGPPAKLVVVKGTQSCDAATARYTEYPLTDVLRMIGQAGRPGVDERGVAVVMVFDPMKSYYKKCLYEPLMIESALGGELSQRLLAEVARGAISDRQAAVNYLSWTFLGRRLLQNPSYYGLHSRSEKDVATHLSRLVDAALERDLAPTLVSEEADGKLHVTKLGSLAVQHGLALETARRLPELLRPDLQPMDALFKLASLPEFRERLHPRYNDDTLVARLAAQTSSRPPGKVPGSAHAMGLALVEAHIGRTPLHMPDLRADQEIAVAAARSMVHAALELGPEGLVSLLSWALVSQSLQARAWWTRGEILPIVAMILDLPVKQSKDRRGGASSDGVIARVHPAPGGASALDLEIQWPEGRGRRANGGAAGDAGPPRAQPEPRWLVIACEARSKRLLEWRALDAAPRAGQAELRM